MTDPHHALPILYSFRRCPYAMRARLALKVAGVEVQLREILLKNKPQPMLEISPKGTVPVLQLPSGQVIDESRDIMAWAAMQSGGELLVASENVAQTWLDINDFEFKQHLDHYKYADRYPERPAAFYRSAGERFLMRLEQQLQLQKKAGVPNYLLGLSLSQADIGIIPFVRQFSMVDQPWFESTGYECVKKWLHYWLGSEIFSRVMRRYPQWHASEVPTIF
ncbi:glutathione S-transferase [Simiduia litorea]|uniref:glutathione S-transferase n=1 Tax=Simiduia litorea TaxID=1435348 RepID=UPI0036F31277